MSFQQIILVGNLGKDPEMRYTPTGVPVTSFNMAVSRTWTDQSGQRQEKTTWFRVTAWRKLAEVVSQYATKGRQVMVVGELEEARTYTDRDGNVQISLEVTAQQFKLLGNRAEGGGGGGGSYSGAGENHSGSAERGHDGPSASTGGRGSTSDEDIPF